eukprot:m.125930 g.125930  ORF g.125930 m.125930 type:complete len:533 (+) comp15763_c0_seq2:148-1746(+)
MRMINLQTWRCMTLQKGLVIAWLLLLVSVGAVSDPTFIQATINVTTMSKVDLSSFGPMIATASGVYYNTSKGITLARVPYNFSQGLVSFQGSQFDPRMAILSPYVFKGSSSNQTSWLVFCNETAQSIEYQALGSPGRFIWAWLNDTTAIALSIADKESILVVDVAHPNDPVRSQGWQPPIGPIADAAAQRLTVLSPRLLLYQSSAAGCLGVMAYDELSNMWTPEATFVIAGGAAHVGGSIAVLSPTLFVASLSSIDYTSDNHTNEQSLMVYQQQDSFGTWSQTQVYKGMFSQDYDASLGLAFSQNRLFICDLAATLIRIWLASDNLFDNQLTLLHTHALGHSVEPPWSWPSVAIPQQTNGWQQLVLMPLATRPNTRVLLSLNITLPATLPVTSTSSYDSTSPLATASDATTHTSTLSWSSSSTLVTTSARSHARPSASDSTSSETTAWLTTPTGPPRVSRTGPSTPLVIGLVVAAFVLLLSVLIWCRYRALKPNNRYLIDLNELADGEVSLDLEADKWLVDHSYNITEMVEA